jgi:DNA primase
MARIKDSSKRDVVEAADMVEVVSARTQLRKQGARFVGRCPFHEERTPSFSVNPQEKLFYCFGCQKGGDVITFVRETEQLDFTEAVEWLAERFRVTVEYEESSPRLDADRQRRERLFQLLEQAAVFYERHLWESPAGEDARRYLGDRSLGEEVCREFRLGVAPGGDLLARRARERGFTLDELRAAGLVNRRGNDYFGRRLLFPLADARGRVRGFGARRMYDDDPVRAKYVNSPEGELFHKSSIVYGVDKARGTIAKEERAVIVEGYTDVLALRQAGFEPVVASMGTALTEEQLKELRRLAHRLYLCFDADAAGEAATLRGMELAARRGFDIRVVTLSPGTDPADEVEGFRERLAGAESYIGYLVRLEIDRAGDRQEAFERVRAALERFEDSPERQEAWRYANDKLGLTVQLQSRMSTTKPTVVSRRVVDAGDRLERDVLAACFAFPSLLGALEKLSPEHFDTERNRRLRHALLTKDADEETAPALAELDAVAATEAIDETTAKELLLRLRERHLRRELSSADLEQAAELQKKLLEIREAVAELA